MAVIGLKYRIGELTLIGCGLFLILFSCVDKIDFKIPLAHSQLVIEGMISDNPGPYTVKVSSAVSLDIDSIHRFPVQNMKIKLYDDEGKVEDLNETAPGEYMTNGMIQGRIGHSYHIKLETPDGRMFESEPDSIQPIGALQDIRYEFEARSTEKVYGTVPADVFNIYLDADAGVSDNPYVRWRFTGTYEVSTNPEQHTTFLQNSAYMTPLPCSGYIVLPALGGGKLEKVGECTCCICWVTQYEEKPLLSDAQLVNNNQFKNVKIAEVPITTATFYDKFLVQVEQMSLTRKSFEFFKLIRTQKETASSIFQPPTGEIRGNIKAMNSSDAVVGLFWATSISTKSIYILRSDVPYLLTPINFVPNTCALYPNAASEKPKFWE